MHDLDGESCQKSRIKMTKTNWSVARLTNACLLTEENRGLKRFLRYCGKSTCRFRRFSLSRCSLGTGGALHRAPRFKAFRPSSSRECLFSLRSTLCVCVLPQRKKKTLKTPASDEPSPARRCKNIQIYRFVRMLTENFFHKLRFEKKKNICVIIYDPERWITWLVDR